MDDQRGRCVMTGEDWGNVWPRWEDLGFFSGVWIWVYSAVQCCTVQCCTVQHHSYVAFLCGYPITRVFL